MLIAFDRLGGPDPFHTLSPDRSSRLVHFAGKNSKTPSPLAIADAPQPLCRGERLSTLYWFRLAMHT